MAKSETISKINLRHFDDFLDLRGHPVYFNSMFSNNDSKLNSTKLHTKLELGSTVTVRWR